jgi:hypothetical protein
MMTTKEVQYGFCRPDQNDDAAIIAAIDAEIARQPTKGMAAGLDEHRYRPALHRQLWDEFVSKTPHYSTLGSLEKTVEVSWGEGESRNDVIRHIMSLGFVQPWPGHDHWEKDGLTVELRRAMRQGEQRRQGGYEVPGIVIMVAQPVKAIDPDRILG